MIVFIAVNAALISLRLTDPMKLRPFRIPLSIRKIPLLPVWGIIVSFTFLFQFDLLVYATGLLAFAVAAGIYFLHRYILRRSQHA
jgi:APA family basic amino acid/polyamine antiporter